MRGASRSAIAIAANSVSASATDAGLGKHALERADHAFEVRVVAAALGLDADRNEHVGVPFSGCRYALRKTIFARGGMRAKSKPSPQTSTRSVSARRSARAPSSSAGTARARRRCSGSCRRG